ncbi:MAG: ribosomal protein S18-alanine N-acetyltransferase [candidate division Zixibacteria bacterium]|nr:ribosomal protein S18-alanine N-acetyltransferase [candidate division Zixibacteria bacterium]
MTGLNFDIRPMVSNDLGRIAKIETELFPDPWPMQSFRDSLKNPTGGGFVATSGNRSGESIIGYCLYLHAPGETTLTNIAVRKKYQKMKVGVSLLKTLEDEALQNGSDMVLLEARESNETAILFYESKGYYKIYKRKNYYNSPRESAVVMAHIINSGISSESAPEPLKV